jgi:AraC-like DNA-binding protein
VREQATMSEQPFHLPSVSVSLRRFDETSACDVHDFHQVVLGLEGAMEMIVDGVGQRIDKRYASVIPAGARHEYAGVGENRQVVLDLPPTSLAVPERLFARASVLTLNDAFGALLLDVAASAPTMPPACAVASASIATSIGPSMDAGSSPGERSCDTSSASAVSFRARRLAWDAGTRIAAALAASSGIEPPMAGLDFARIDKWLRAHLSEPLRVADLAAHCGFGARRFHQLFEEAFGTTPHRYLQRLRLDTALALLRDPRNTLTDVALSVGFGDQSAFTHAFTRRFGLAPGQWRAIRPH